MTTTITLSEEDLTKAVALYLEKSGHGKVTDVRFSHDGDPHSPDPRETAVSYSASAEVKGK